MHAVHFDEHLFAACAAGLFTYLPLLRARALFCLDEMRSTFHHRACTHITLKASHSHMQRARRRRIPFATVVTDLGSPHPLWLHPGAHCARGFMLRYTVLEDACAWNGVGGWVVRERIGLSIRDWESGWFVGAVGREGRCAQHG